MWGRRKGAVLEDDAEQVPAPMYRAPLPGSRVLAKRPVVWDGQRVGREMLVQGADATQHAEIIAQARSTIAATWRTAPEAVTFHPLGDNLRVLVRIIDSEPWLRSQQQARARLHGVHLWRGPSLDPAAGCIDFSVTTTDTIGRLTIWKPEAGGTHTWGLGSTGAGKTESFAAALQSAVLHPSQLVVPIVFDGQFGASLGEWEGKAALYGEDPRDVEKKLLIVEREMDQRVALLKSQRAKVLDPTPDVPVLLVVVEEAPEYAGYSGIMRVIDRIGRLGRKVLVVVWWLTQMQQASKAFGNAGSALRGQIKAGNVVVFHADSAAAMTGLDGALGQINPALIPKGVGGAHFLFGPMHPSPVLGRAFFNPDSYDTVGDADPFTFAWSEPVLEEAPAPAASGLAASLGLTPAVSPAPVHAPVEVDGCAAAVLAWFGGRRGVEASTGQVVAALTEDKQWSPRSVKGALALLGERSVLAKPGHGKWVLS